MATTRALEDPEIFAMFSQVSGKYAVRNRTMLMVGIHLALRATELCGLIVSDVYDGGTVRTYVEIRPETAKGKKGRKVRVSSAVGGAILEFLQWKGENGEPLEPDAPLFLSERGAHLSRKMLFVIVKEALQQAGIHESPHCLRKTGATIYYLESDYDLIATQQFLGHAAPATTRDYIGLTSEQLAAYSERSGNRLLSAMREGNRLRLDTQVQMSNRAPNQNEDIKQLQEQLRQKDQIIDRLTRLLSEATSRPEEAPTLERAVHKALVIPIDQARRARGR